MFELHVLGPSTPLAFSITQRSSTIPPWASTPPKIVIRLVEGLNTAVCPWRAAGRSPDTDKGCQEGGVSWPFSSSPFAWVNTHTSFKGSESVLPPKTIILLLLLSYTAECIILGFGILPDAGVILIHAGSRPGPFALGSTQTSLSSVVGSPSVSAPPKTITRLLPGS